MTTLNRITMKADQTAEVLIYDEIGQSWFSDGVSAKGFAETLAGLGEIKNIDVRINSPGGSVFDGLAIYNALVNHAAKVNVFIDGLAASIATVIAMAGDTISIAANAMFMIHEPSTGLFGTAADLRATADTLDAITTSVTGVYVSRGKLTDEEVRAAMAAETWYSADEAKAAGFADVITPNKTISASFDASKFSKAPQWAQDRFKAFTQTKERPMPEGTQSAGGTGTPAPEEKIDVEAIKLQAKAEERERQTQITALCTQAKRPEMAAGFCEDAAMSVADVRAKLFDVLCKDRPAIGDEGGTAGDTKQSDENDKYRAEFKAEKVYAKSMTEDEYVTMRRVDDGLQPLAVSTADTK